MITTYVSVYHDFDDEGNPFQDQSIIDISSFGVVDPIQVAISQLSVDEYVYLIDNIDIKPTGVKSFHFTDKGACFKIEFLIKKEVHVFSFADDDFNFQDEADAGYFKRTAA